MYLNLFSCTIMQYKPADSSIMDKEVRICKGQPDRVKTVTHKLLTTACKVKVLCIEINEVI